MHKGDRLYVEGRIRYRLYDDKQESDIISPRFTWIIWRCSPRVLHHLRQHRLSLFSLCLLSLLQVSRLLRQRIHPLPGLQIRMIYHFKIFSSEIGYIYHNRCFWRCGALVSIYRSSGSRRFSGYLTRCVSFASG